MAYQKLTMAEIIPFKSRGSIDEDARYWLIRLDSNTISEVERRAFKDWQERDPRHQQRFEQLENVWRKSDSLRQLQKSEGEKLSYNRPTPEKRKQSKWWPAVAASVALMIVIVGLWRLVAGPDVQAYQTAVGERLTVTLEGGSVIELNTNTGIEVRNSDSIRAIRLLRGEAHFDVAADKERPFVVTTRNGSVRAVGTTFNISLRDNLLEVVVTEGVVEVAPDTVPAHAQSQGKSKNIATSLSVSVSVGQKVAMVNNQISKVEDVGVGAITRELAWRQGVLIFQDETMAEVIAEVSQHTTKRIIIVDLKTADIRVGGTFPLNDIDKTLAMLSMTFQLAVNQPSPGTVTLRSEEIPL